MSATGIERVPKDYRPWVNAAIDAGWRISQSRHGHLKLTAPDGYATPIPGTSRDSSLHRAIVSRLRKRGVTI